MKFSSYAACQAHSTACTRETCKGQRKFHRVRNIAAGDTVYLNPRTGWWDASFLYGHTPAEVTHSRTGKDGKLHVADDGVPVGADGEPLVGDRNNGWAGVSLLQVCC